MTNNNLSAAEKKIPDFFIWLSAQGLITDENIRKTDDGFFALDKCISDILAHRDITTFKTDGGLELECDKYFDDWYIYAVSASDKFTYGLFKLREQEYDMFAGEKADGDTPGVTVSFIAFDTKKLSDCLEDPTDEATSALSDEINRVVAYSRQRHSPVLKSYFSRTSAQGAYVIARLYVRHIACFAHKGFIIVPEKYEEVYAQSLTMPKGHKSRRLPDFLEQNNKRAGRTVCDGERIYIADKTAPDEFESLAILAVHTADTSFNCFAAEVQYHALFLIPAARVRIPFIGSVYESAIRADLSIDDSEFEGNAPYHNPDSRLVNKHKAIHGEF